MSVLLEVAIGMVALYFLIAAACSFLLEAVHSVTNIRGKAMKLFLFEMLNGPIDEAFDSWIKKLWDWLKAKFTHQNNSNEVSQTQIELFDHPLLSTLKKPEVWLRSKSTEPSYVPSHVISQALFENIVTRFGAFSLPLNQELRTAMQEFLASSNQLPPQIQKELQRLLAECNGPYINLGGLVALVGERIEGGAAALADFSNALPNGELKNCLTYIARFLASGVSDQNLVEFLRSVLPAKEVSFEIIQSIVRGGALPVSLTRSLQTILNASNYDLQQLNAGVERWYDSVMDRASGWFKRRSILLLGMFAFVFAALFNFDSFNIAKQLFEKPALRQSVSQLASQLVAQGDANSSKLVPMLMLQERARANQWAKEDRDPKNPSMTKDEALERARETVLLTLIDPAILAESLFLLEEKDDSKPLTQKIAWQSCAKNAPSAAAGSVPDSTKLPEYCVLQNESLTAANKCDFLSNKIYSWDSSLTKKSCELYLGAQAGEYRDALVAWKKELTVFLERTKILNESFLESSKLVDDIGLIWEIGEQKGWWKLIVESEPSNSAKAKSLREKWNLVFDSTASKVILLVLLLELCVIWFWRSYWPNLLFVLTIAWVIVTCVSGIEWDVAALWRCVAGWLMTALMVSFGAPFWFDLLNKLVNRRAAGPKPGVNEGLGS